MTTGRINQVTIATDKALIPKKSAPVNADNRCTEAHRLIEKLKPIRLTLLPTNTLNKRNRYIATGLEGSHETNPSHRTP